MRRLALHAMLWLAAAANTVSESCSDGSTVKDLIGFTLDGERVSNTKLEAVRWRRFEGLLAERGVSSLVGIADCGRLRGLRATRAVEAGPEAKRRKRQDKAAKEAKEAEAHAKKLGLGDGSADSLAAAIVARNKQRDGDAFLNSLAERFGGKGEENGGGKKGKGGGGNKGKGKGKAAASMNEDPLDDAAFAAAQAKMLGKGKR